MATVSCDDETRDQLRRLKVGGETYDDVLRRILEEYDEG